MQPCSVRLGGRSRRAERGWLVVPERRDHASARQIRLPVVRVLADRPRGRPPVFRLGGGPGLSNMRFGCPPALAAHDVTLAGYRGVDARLGGRGLLAAAGASALPPPRGGNAATIDSSRARLQQADALPSRRTERHGPVRSLRGIFHQARVEGEVTCRR
jgi:hypothetical protein